MIYFIFKYLFFIARVAGDNAFAVVRPSVCPSVCPSVRPSVRVTVTKISHERINISTPNRISRTISQPLLILKKFQFKMAEQCHHLENPLNGSISLNIAPIGSVFFLKCSEFSQKFIS